MSDDGYVRVGDLRAALVELPDDMLVVMSKDAEGNDFSPLSEVEKDQHYEADSTWSGAAVGVCGFARCGSTMLMRMLDAGGLPPCEGSAPGSYELPWIELEDLASRELGGRAVKLLDSPMHRMVPAREGGWKFILMERSAREQAKSTVKFMSALMPEIPVAADELERSYVTDRPRLLKALGALGPVLLLEFEKVLADPLREAREIAVFLRPEIPVDENFAFFAAAVVLKRDGKCRPDLAIELEIMERTR